MAILRIVVIVLASVLGVAFLLRGDYVIGALVLTLAVTRAVMVGMVVRRHRDLRGGSGPRR